MISSLIPSIQIWKFDFLGVLCVDTCARLRGLTANIYDELPYLDVFYENIGNIFDKR